MQVEVSLNRKYVRSAGRSVRYALVRLTAPQAMEDSPRVPVHVAFVIDRSGSMRGRKLDLACQAVAHAIGLLSPTDRFAVVTYDGEVKALHAASTAHPAVVNEVRERLRTVSPGAGTNLGAGWLTGCAQIAEIGEGKAVARTLLLTDGLANRGICNIDELILHAAELRRRGVATTTFGLGADFVEPLLEGMARSGGGSFTFIENSEQIPDSFASELGEALEVVVRQARLELDLPRGVRIRPLSDFRLECGDGAARVLLGDLASGQMLDVVLRLEFDDGALGETIDMRGSVVDAEGTAWVEEPFEVTFVYADPQTNDYEPRNRAVDREVALLHAARARREAVMLNRHRRYDDAVQRIREAVSQIESHAGGDAELRKIVEALERDAEVYAAAMCEMARKRRYIGSSSVMRSRESWGGARRCRT